MPAYHFIAVNQGGQEQKGVLEAESEKHARQLLRDKSLIPVKVRAAQEKKGLRKESQFTALFSRQRRLSSKELALITRQFATLLSAGLPIEEALQAVSEQTEKSHVKGLVLSVRSKIVEGHALASALREHPESFSALFCATIAAGEKSGHLDKVLLRLADYTEQQWHMRQKLKTALIYPAMIVLVAMGIVGFLLEYVVPKMIAVYGRLNQALPTLTTVLISISQFVGNYGLYFLLLIIAGIFFWRRALKKNALLREKTHQFLLRLPLIGYAIKTADTARFARTLSILSAAGVSVLEAMRISAQLITTIPIRNAVEEAVDRVREGAAIHLALKQTGYFSPMSVHMISSGEASGQLEGMLERVAQNQEDEITRLIEVGLALFEPAIILIMGAIVLFIVLAVLLPIFQLNEFTG
ncbi:type II secretion system inner membrane protein GspF [Aquicella lusitana]|uniref:General secretion pathway protein F n=1 Tax=Aquicella lusitana TaxID=254246 RepID=A0A370G3B2_9COXI|nr:type II secretion system inner membrane protein GspF [Aquicella lusitana]RDI37506.1 type II secretion system protein F (GspF) [Aquicella lusitana]VVC72630.1 Type II secretion system protein F [Aquicella lusitana]